MRFRARSPSSRRSTCARSRKPASKKPGRSSEGPMNWKKVFAVVRREYVERVPTKAFWIGTLLIPALLFGIIGFQIALSKRSAGERQMAVVDTTHSLFAPLQTELDNQERERRAKHPGEPA